MPSARRVVGNPARIGDPKRFDGGWRCREALHLPAEIGIPEQHAQVYGLNDEFRIVERRRRQPANLRKEPGIEPLRALVLPGRLAVAITSRNAGTPWKTSQS